MRRVLFLLVVLAAVSLTALGQSNNPVPINLFNVERDSTTWIANEGGTTLTIAMDTVDKVEGRGAWRVHANLASLHQWGTYAQFGYSLPDSVAPWDWSLSDTISLWLKVNMPASVPANIVLRLQIADRPNPSDSKEEYIYDNPTILRNASGWINLKVPLIERVSDGTTVPDTTGFVVTPSGWGGMTWNDHVLNRDKIVEWNIGIITSGWDPAANLPADSVDVTFDNYIRTGMRAIPMVIFNGKVLQSNVVNTGTSPWSWGASSASIETGAGTSPKLNAIKWVQGDEWGNGWTGWGVDVAPAFNLAGGWVVDSMKFKIKADTGTGNLRVQIESATGKRGTVFAPITDNTWHDYAFKLSDMTVQDGAPAFDSSAITKFGIMAEGTGKAGKVLYITDIWTGNPVFDLVPPDSATGLAAIGSNYSNLFSWNPVTNKSGITYNVFYATHPWTDPTDPTVMDLPPYNLTSPNAIHALRSPNTDQNVTYYYGVIAKDGSGNVSPAAVMSTPVTTLAKGVPTISLTPPTSILANESLTEWKAANIRPFLVSMDSGTAHAKPNASSLAGDADCSARVYVAVDNTYLYVAFDVTDDHVVVDTASSANDWEQDSPDMFIGLYDWQGKFHGGLNSTDVHFRFSQNRLKIDNGGKILMWATPGGGAQNPDYIWLTKSLTPGYVVKARISWASIAAAMGTSAFVPANGMHIPIDFEFNDRDDATKPSDSRKGELCYSINNNDNSYQNMYNWTDTWIGNLVLSVDQVSDVPRAYELSQNYPNPFNPSTQIRYSIQKAGDVSLKIYDMLGREVVSLVDTYQPAGSYVVTVDAASRSLSSGVYLYRLQSGSFVAAHKMLLLK